jgi:hypothetical protein
LMNPGQERLHRNLAGGIIGHVVGSFRARGGQAV